MQDYEKLGVFYLGRRYDQAMGKIVDEDILYDSKDLTTHAVCVGMTGSGKTGLCISLLEEAAIDGIPAIVIDPKGDLGNLMLTFPNLQPGDFRPWVDESEAARKGMTVDQYAAKTAETWKKGLASWDEDSARISRLRNAAEVAIYTPGSNAGLQVSVLRSFDCPPAEVMEDHEAFRDRIQTAVSGVLTLLGLSADPLKSREHILVSNILDQVWRSGRSLDLPGLIAEIQNPPFDRVGVFNLESFFPADDRMELAMRINNLLASPGFSAWVEGEPLNMGRLLYTEAGKPRIAIMSIAHLSDSERMFFVTTLLNETLSWMRAQPGTSSLRAILYMDEIFGYFPPTAEPPSKRPMLTLLKQARAYGLGVVLATQNPVDLDYKGLANAGTWFIGRLQTKRDRMRVLDGLEGAAMSGGGFERDDMEKILSALDSRVFLMNNVHDNEPVVFHTRWVMSYLRGPLTRAQIGILTDKAKKEATSRAAPLAKAAEKAVKEDREAAEDRPALPDGVGELFLSQTEAAGDGNRLVFRPRLLAQTDLHYVRAGAKIDEWSHKALIAKLPGDAGRVDWGSAKEENADQLNLGMQAPEGGEYAQLPRSIMKAKNVKSWQGTLETFLYQQKPLEIWKSPDFKVYSKSGEGEGEFRGRVAQLAREKRDIQVEEVKASFEKRFATLKAKIQRAEDKVEKEKAQYGHQKLQTAISIGATLLGAILGRRATSARSIGSAATAMRGAGRATRERGDIGRAEAALEDLQHQLKDMEKQLKEKLAEMSVEIKPEDMPLEKIIVRPRKSDILVKDIAVLWTPWRVSPEGIAERLF